MVWQIIVIVKPIHLSFTHTVPQSERKKNTNYFQTVLFCYDQSQQRSGHPSKSQNHKKIAVVFHTWLASSCTWIPEYISLEFRVFWISQKIGLKFLKSNKDCNRNIFVVVVFKFVSFVFQGPQKHRSQLILLDRYM